LLEHAEKMTQTTKLIHKAALSPDCAKGHFVAPQAFEISDLSILEKEVFGPILHIIRFKSDQLPNVVESINKTGYGLTLGIQTRIQTTMDYIRDHAKVGNMYVNRNMIGAVVGVQPFGGEGLSGTGPKAGGPHALFRHAIERTYTVNTTAIGGNTSLVTMNEDD
ncbi:MAG: aldehyde dehydrogenase family protein, partial [Alphaproteobacteria bacterium]|nr:aldehyde dehydrogenase family protein [Alphaproteobacteria bacterium]